MRVVCIIVRSLNILVEKKQGFYLVYTLAGQLMGGVLMYCARITQAIKFYFLRFVQQQRDKAIVYSYQQSDF